MGRGLVLFKFNVDGEDPTVEIEDTRNGPLMEFHAGQVGWKQAIEAYTMMVDYSDMGDVCFDEPEVTDEFKELALGDHKKYIKRGQAWMFKTKSKKGGK